MQNYRLTLQYNGTRYPGWQKPEKGGQSRTISGKIAAVLNRMTDEEIILHAGAKTEAGVHALAQTSSFKTACALSPDEILRGLNQYLPADIAVTDCEQVPERFQADLNAVSRTYEYRICTAPVYDIFTAGYTAHIHPGPDVKQMENAAGYLIGTHDFRGFSGGRQKKGTEKTITDIRISQLSRITITITADNFLYRMPSLLIGTLIETGLGKRTPESLSAILEGKEKAEALCDPKGLLLKSVQYKSVQ